MRIVLEVVTQLTNQNAGRRTQDPEEKGGKTDATSQNATQRSKNMDSLHQTKKNRNKHRKTPGFFSTILLFNFQNGSGILAIEF